MNKRLSVLSLAVWMIWPASCSAVEDIGDSMDQRWQTAFELRVRVVEQIHGIKFDAGWKPALVFMVPDSIPPHLQAWFGAQYVPETQSFVVSPLQKNDIGLYLIDHELGHALVDQISRRNGKGMWPDIEGYKTLEWSRKIGVNLMSEGMGSYFEYQGQSPYAKGDAEGYEWLPPHEGHILWGIRDFLYNGGRWLVAPIIRQFGERGIVYLVSHPLSFQKGNVRKAALEYQRVALKELAQK